MTRILVAGVGNLLRGDDGFGPAVIERLGELPAGAESLETGIGGVGLLQELRAGCVGLGLVAAVARGAAPGTVFELEPTVGEAVHVADVHLANPDRVLSMARTMGALPGRVRIVGCQPAEVDELGGGLSPCVEEAVGRAVPIVRRIVDVWLREGAHAGL